MLTDGEPNSHPPLGEVKTLELALSEYNKRSFSINTFGFGYSLDSRMLNDIAVLGDGYYGYIPDCTMVGTIFVNFLANTLSIAHNTLALHLESKQMQEIFGGEKVIQLGAVRYGQTRSISTWVPSSI